MSRCTGLPITVDGEYKIPSRQEMLHTKEHLTDVHNFKKQILQWGKGTQSMLTVSVYECDRGKFSLRIFTIPANSVSILQNYF